MSTWSNFERRIEQLESDPLSCNSSQAWPPLAHYTDGEIDVLAVIAERVKASGGDLTAIERAVIEAIEARHMDATNTN